MKTFLGGFHNSLYQNLKFLIKDYWQWKPSLIWMGCLYIPLGISVPLLIALVPKMIIDMIENGTDLQRILLAIPLIVLGMVLICIIERIVKLYITDIGPLTMFRYMVALDTKTMEMDYEYIVSNKGKNLREKAYKLMQGGEASYVFYDFLYLVLNLGGLIFYSSILISLHPIIIVSLCFSYVVNWYVQKRINIYIQNRRTDEAEVSKGIRYLSRNAMDISAAKDIRMYGMKEWLKKTADLLIKKQSKVLNDVARHELSGMVVDAVLILLRDGVAYALLIYKVLQGEVSTGNFLVYFTAISNFAKWITGIISSYSDLDLDNRGFSDFREYIDVKSKMNMEGGCPLPTKSEWPCELELRNVSFTYAESNKPIIRNLNLKINAGERIAVVGLNGSGKTTLVKLICGLLRPTEGEILVNGVSASKFNRDDYYSLFSVIFQDVHVLPLSIAENITLQTKYKQDRVKMQCCIKQAGLDESINHLANGVETLLVRSVNEDAVELSGGEVQKLLLARALYKEAPILILDEPTAALDPLAESKLYLQYRDMTEECTSLFVSHRLASTRFCDRIIMMEQGEIIEEGDHEELMLQNGRYAEMFKVQSQYYQGDIKEND